MQEVRSALAFKFGGHAKHVLCPVVLLKVFSWHTAQLELCVSSANVPSAHLWQIVAPVEFENRPGAHAAHIVARLVSLKNPTAHDVQLELWLEFA